MIHTSFCIFWGGSSEVSIFGGYMTATSKIEMCVYVLCLSALLFGNCFARPNKACIEKKGRIFRYTLICYFVLKKVTYIRDFKLLYDVD